MNTLKKHALEERFLSEWGSLAMLVAFQAGMTLAALLQSGGMALVRVKVTQGEHIYYHTEGRNVVVALIGATIVLMLVEYVATLLSHKLESPFCGVLYPVFFLTGMGLLNNCYANYDDFKKHCLLLVMAVVLVAVVVLFSCAPEIPNLPEGMCAGMLLLMLFNLGFGLTHKINGSGSWLRFGRFSIQPSEIAKIFVVMMACYFYREIKRRDSRHVRWMFSVTCVFSVVVLFAVGDVGNAVVLVLLTGIVFLLYFGWVASVLLVVDTTVLAVILLGVYFVLHGRFPQKFNRVTMTLQVLNAGREDGDIRHMLLGVLRGGFFGVGTGTNSLYTVSNKAASSDYAYLTILSLFGALTAVLVVLAFVLLLKATDYSDMEAVELSQYLSKVSVAAIIIPAIIHIGGSVNVLPFTGVNLPFISSGGTSLLTSYFVVGVLVSNQVDAKVKNALTERVETLLSSLHIQKVIFERKGARLK